MKQRKSFKRKTECENRINTVKVRFGLGEINSEIYTATMSELNYEIKQKYRRELEDAGKNLIEHDEIYQSND